MTQYLRMSLIFDKTVKALIPRIYYKENYLKPNSDPGTLQTPVQILAKKKLYPNNSKLTALETGILMFLKELLDLLQLNSIKNISKRQFEPYHVKMCLLGFSTR